VLAASDSCSRTALWTASSTGCCDGCNGCDERRGYRAGSGCEESPSPTMIPPLMASLNSLRLIFPSWFRSTTLNKSSVTEPTCEDAFGVQSL